MPSYDIIPLASDLLDYTIQRVKQKEAEYKPVKAYIMVGDQLVEKLLYDKVKDDGKPHFPKSQTFHLCAELQDCAVRILKGCEAANGRYFETEYEERLKDLDGVLIECQTMEQLINLSYGRKYITGDQCNATIGRSWCARSVKRLSTGGNQTATVPPPSGRPRRPRSLPRWGKWPCKLRRPCGLSKRIQRPPRPCIWV